MTLHFHTGTTVAELQKDFQAHFPFLKLVFFRNPIEETQDFWANYMVLNNQILITELSANLPVSDEGLTISPNMTIAEFENTLYDRYALTVRIFRKQYGDLVETTDSRHLDLEGQNEHGASTNRIVEDITF
jgi:hypothetical protein